MTSSIITNPLTVPSDRYIPIQFNKGPEFYQNELSNSYLDHRQSGVPITKFSSKGKVYELRDATPTDISNVALRDGKMESLLLGVDGLVRRLIANSEKPDIPVGFYVGRRHPEHARTLEMFYHYVSPKYREHGLGSVQRADLLHLATAMAEFDKLLSIQKPRSNFYESLDSISSVLKKNGLFFYEVDLSDKAKARKVIEERLKEVGIEILN